MEISMRRFQIRHLITLVSKTYNSLKIMNETTKLKLSFVSWVLIVFQLVCTEDESVLSSLNLSGAHVFIVSVLLQHHFFLTTGPMSTILGICWQKLFMFKMSWWSWSFLVSLTAFSSLCLFYIELIGWNNTPGKIHSD